MSIELSEIDLPEFGTELCDMDGAEAASVLTHRLYNPELPITIGGKMLTDLVGVDHDNGGRLRIMYLTDDSLHTLTFSAEPEKPFAETAVDPADNPICMDC